MKSLLEKTKYNDVAIGLFREDSLFKAVAVKKSADNFELLWHRKASDEQMGWNQFCSQIISPVRIEHPLPLILGYDSNNVVFYNIQIPPIRGSQVDVIVKMQAETLLPLPIDQMKLAWRLNRLDDDKNTVTIAAARMDELKNFLPAAGICLPDQIILDCSAMVKSWNMFFAPNYSTSKIIFLHAKADRTRICLLESGQLIRASSLTHKSEDFAKPETEAMFINDLCDTLDDFGCAAISDADIFVISEDKIIAENLTKILTQHRINAQKALPDKQLLDSFKGCSCELLAEFIVPIGLSLAGFETRTSSLNLFEQIYRLPREKNRTDKSDSQLRRFSIIAAVLLVVFVCICFASDKIKLAQMKKHFNNTDPNSNLAQLVEKQKLRKKIANQRPSVIDLLARINKDRKDTVLLNSILFKKGLRSSITGQTKDSAELAKFAESLAKQNGISEVRIQNQSFDEKKKQLNFTITFHYRNFTKKNK